MASEVVVLQIDDLAYDGRSVAHHEGKVVFLNGGLPGETVEAEIVRTKPRYDVARVLKITVKGPQRIEAPCPHFEDCGGCTWQDLAYTSQLAFKRNQVVQCLERLTDIEDAVIDDVVGAVELYHYRNKMEFSFNVNSDGFNLGLHRRGRFDEVFDIHDCHLQSQLCNRIVVWVRDFVVREEIAVYDVIKHEGYFRFLALRQAKRTAGLMVNIVTNYGEFPHREAFISGITSEFPEVTTILHNQNGQKSNVATGEIEQVLFGPGYMTERLFDRTFHIRANSFFQTNSIQAETLYRIGFEMLDVEGNERALDLYSGTGSIGILLAPHVQEVIGVELVADAVRMARENAEFNEIDNATFFEGTVRDFLKTDEAQSEPVSIVIIDPPRAGLHPKALKRIIALHPDKLLYFSCNPATFARDADALTRAGFTMGVIRPIDMFPHTRHIELVALFRSSKS